MKNWWLVLCFLPFWVVGQSISVHNPQLAYDSPGGLFDTDSIRDLHITFEDANYHNVLVHSFFNNPDHRIPATITLNGVDHDSAGVRYKGNSTFCIPTDNGVPKVPYNIDMNHWVSGQTIMDYKKLKLANAYMDATFMKELIASEIYKAYIPSPEVSPLKLHVQGNYLGLYVNTESINKQFLEKHFGEKDGVLFKCDNINVFCGDSGGAAPAPSLRWLGLDSTNYYDAYDLKSNHGWTQMLYLIGTLNGNPSALGEVLNIDRALWQMAVSTVIGNYDTYNGYYVHNYYLYQTGDSLFQMLPWDLDQSFLNALLGDDINTPLGPGHPSHWNPYSGEDQNWGRPLTAFLFNDPLYRKQYTAHIRTLLQEIDTSDVRTRVNYMQGLCFNAANSDPNKLFSMSDYYSNVEEHLALIWWGGYGFGAIMQTLRERCACVGQ